MDTDIFRTRTLRQLPTNVKDEDEPGEEQTGSSL